MSLSVRRSLLVFITAVALPALFMGFITMPGQSHQVAHEKNGLIDIEALMHKVLLLNQQKKHQEAVDLLMAAMEKNQEDSLLRTLLVQTFEMFLDDEIRFGQQDIQENKNNIGAYLRVAGALELMGDNFRAMETLINGVSLNPNASALWMKVGKLEHKAKRDLEALDIFKEVIRLDPKSSDAYNNVAFILAQSTNCNAEDLKLAETYAEKARKLDPKNPEYLDTLAEVNFRQGDSIQAQTLIKEAIKLAPERNSFKDQLRRFSQKSPVLFE